MPELSSSKPYCHFHWNFRSFRPLALLSNYRYDVGEYIFIEVFMQSRYQIWYMWTSQPEQVSAIVPTMMTLGTMRRVLAMIYTTFCRFVSLHKFSISWNDEIYNIILHVILRKLLSSEMKKTHPRTLTWRDLLLYDVRLFSRSIRSMQRTIFTSLENHTLGIIFLLLLLGFIKGIKIEKDFILI